MTARTINFFVADFSDPNSDLPQQGSRVPANISYGLHLEQNLRTLSTNNGKNLDNVEGFLFVPDLEPSDPCSNISTQYIPQNVTRLSNVQNLQTKVIALAPWISQECTLSYLAAANQVPVSGFITYVPNNQTAIPPPVNDPQWGLNDGGQWKSNYQFPVYAITGASGFAVMQQLPQYSGNLSTIKNSAQLLSAGVLPTDVVRIYCNVQTSEKTNMPTLWAFLLIVLGLVLFLVACTSLAMHWYQRHARNRLQRRVANGAIDLEALGIRRLTVPQEVLDKLPTYVYTADTQELPIVESPEAVRLARPHSSLSPLPAGSEELVASDHSRYNQPACAICLEDFVSRSTTVRELPCRHIYHTDCINEFLLHHSSLCPVCKNKALPKGYCPQAVTNSMVRRERQLRRLAGRRPVAAGQAAGAGIGRGTSRRPLAVHGRMASFHRQFGPVGLPFSTRRTSNAPVAASSVELAGRISPIPAVSTSAASVSRPASQAGGDRRDRARRRVSTLLGNQVMVEDEERERQQRLPRWRKAVRTVFPGFT